MRKTSRTTTKQLDEHKSSMRLPGGWQLPPFGAHQILALAIVAVALWSVSIVWLVLQAGEQWVGSWQDDIKVHVYVDKPYEANVPLLESSLRDIDGVADVRRVSLEEARDWMEAWLGGEDLNAESFVKHLPVSLEITLEVPRVASVLDDIRDAALARHGEVNADEFNLVQADDLLNTIQGLAWFATMVLALAMALIISNTLRMTLLARADEVHLMRLMGAKEWFVRLPFVLEGLWLGAGAGFAAWILIWPLIWLTSDWQSSLSVDLSGWSLFLPLLFGGAVVGGLGALLATTRIVSPEAES